MAAKGTLLSNQSLLGGPCFQASSRASLNFVYGPNLFRKVFVGQASFEIAVCNIKRVSLLVLQIWIKKIINPGAVR